MIRKMQTIKSEKIKYPEALVVTCFILFFFLYSCAGKTKQTAKEVIETSLNAIGTKADRAKIKNLVSLADCMSPNGKYSTEIYTAFGGYSYVKQVYSYKPTAFEAVIENNTSGCIIGVSIQPLSKEAIHAIRSHEFQNIILDVDQRFHDFGSPEIKEFEGTKEYRLQAKDNLNNECSLFFNVGTGLLSAIHFRNPDSSKEIIKTKFSNWKNQQDLLLPFHV